MNATALDGSKHLVRRTVTTGWWHRLIPFISAPHRPLSRIPYRVLCWVLYWTDVDNAVVAGNFGFPAGVAGHSALWRHLTAQEQDKSDNERDANNCWRSERREILQHDASST
ncbi:MAG TPA: hypothetical protein VGD68_01410 [Streptosporangiaceae bacterium]